MKRLSIPDADLVRAREIELASGRAANCGAAAVPDAVAHMGVGRVIDPGAA